MEHSASLTIGDFSRATHVSVKMLRHYHRIGLLQPADVDQRTGYRRYTTEQIPTAQVIRRFRAMDMRLEEIRAVLTAPDLATRNALITGHLDRLEDGLARVRDAVTSLRALLDPSMDAEYGGIERRTVDPTPAVAITQTVSIGDALPWFQGALGELYAALAAQDVLAAGPAGAVFAAELFAEDRGQATVFVPCVGALRPLGRVAPYVVPGAELAIATHAGPHTGVDRAYGRLATHVASHALAVDGPVREYYLVGMHDTVDESRWLTEIGWPVFRIGDNE